ncbi:DUF1957 domain-containing protein, partial [Myxococcota bacterium]|nr:DUF1957 domain-containing protein [Myxococcota bacterium]
MPQGYLALVLHAHLPFVRHPEYSNFLEEDWLYEAITETYIPLLQMYNRLESEGVPYKMTMSLTPTLLSMLADDVLKRRYGKHLDKMVELADKECLRTKDDAHFNYLSIHYRDQFMSFRDFWNGWQGDLVGAFREIMNTGNLDIITCGATHGYLPLMRKHPQSVRAQIGVAVDNHTRLLGQAPKGIWLPECAFYPELDKILAAYGLRYFIVDTHGINYAHPR